MARPAAAHRTANPPNPTDLKPVGSPPKDAPPRVKGWWRSTVRDWPQLSRRDRQALLDYCHALIEQEDLRALVELHGRFHEVDRVNSRGEVIATSMKETPYYAALVRVDGRLQSLRRDFAALAGYRERAKAVTRTHREKGKPLDEVDSI